MAPPAMAGPVPGCRAWEMSLWTLGGGIRRGNKCQGGLAVHPELRRGARQSPELEPALGWAAWLGLEGVPGRELDATSGICPSQQGHGVVAVAAAVPWGTWLCFPAGASEAVLGLGADPNPHIWPHLRPGCLGHLGCSADSLPVRFALPRWPRDPRNGGSEQGWGTALPPPACSPRCPREQRGVSSSPHPGVHHLGCQQDREGVSGGGGVSPGGVGRQPLP